MSLLVGAASNSATGYTLNNSLRFRSSASAYLSRTPGSAGNRRTWTWSGWVKRGKLGVIQAMFDATNSGNVYHLLRFYANDTLNLTLDNTGTVSTTAVFRDPSAWYHFVVVMDTTQSTSTDRVKIYVNGVLQTTTGTYPGLNVEGNVNSANQHSIGRYIYGNSQFYDGYIAELNLVDGQALTPTSFGETDDNGTWVPKKYTGTYGTNGFYLDFEDTSSVAALGTDSSGNGNTWTVNNVSLTAGTTYDSMKDVPTLTDEDTANFATLNPLSSRGVVPTDGNLTDPAFGANQSTTGTIGVSSGKWYFEVKGNSPYWVAGVTTLSTVAYGLSPNSTGAQGLTVYSANGSKYNNGSATAYGATYTTNDIMAIALDLDAGTITWYKNNVSQGVAFTGLSGTYFPVLGGPDGWAHGTINFGQRPFSYTPPTGFLKLNTFNLPDSAIEDGSTNFNTVLYTGTGAIRSVTGVGFQTDWVWIKERSGVANHGLYDAVRGVEKDLISNTTGAETTQSTGLTAFDSDGFTTGVLAKLNTNTDTYVAWNWKANGSGSSNGDGSISSTVSANTTAGFSVVTFADSGAVGATVGHGLGQKPSVVIQKPLGTGNWYTLYDFVDGSYDYLLLNTTAAKTNSTLAPATSTVFSNLQLTGNSLAYCFADVEGYSKFGSYTGNGNANGAFVYTGFKPKMVIIKTTSAAFDWVILDTERNPYNLVHDVLYPSLANTEADATTYASFDAVSNGFKLRNTHQYTNYNGYNYIYMAFAENPFKNSTAR